MSTLAKYIKSLLNLLLTLFFSLSLFSISLAQTPEDETIMLRVNKILQSNDALTSSQIKVSSVNNYVLLTGQILSAAQRSEASASLVFSSGATRLINELEVVNTIDTSFAEADEALRKMIQDDIQYIGPNSVVIVHRGTIHLMGTVDREEAKYASSRISKIDGVANIRLSYEFTD